MTAQAEPHAIHSPDGRLHLTFNSAGDILRFYEQLPDGGTVDYFHRPDGNKNPMMHPWCNRVKGGVFTFEGQEHILRPLHGAENNALHGNWTSPWSVETRGDHEACFMISCKAEDGSSPSGKRTPYEYDAAQILTLDNDGLNVQMTVVNRGITLPFAIGLHPFFPRPQDTILQFDATMMENCQADMIPDPEQPLVPIPENWTLSEGFNVSDENLSPPSRGFGFADRMDNSFVGVDPKEGATITWPTLGGTGRKMKITASENCRYAVCYVPRNDPPAPLSLLCVEFTMSAIDMQNRLDEDTGAVILAAGEKLQAHTRFSVSPL